MLRLGEVVAAGVAAAAERDPRVWVIDGDLGDSYGLDGIAARVGARHIQAGIAEQTMVSLAAGLAACGARPWVFSFAAFLCCRAYDQIRVCVSQTRLPVVLVGSHAGGCAGANGKTHALLNDLALMATLPDVEVFAPADARETRAIVDQLAAAPRAAYLRLPRDPQPDLAWPADAAPGGCVRFGAPGPLAVIATGLGTQWALRALAARGVALPVVHVARLAPFPADDVARALGPAVRLIAVEDHYEVGGLADLVRRHHPALPVRALGWPRGWAGASGEAEAVRTALGLGDAALAAACVDELARLVPSPTPGGVR